ncbi:MAG: hypothetical protein KKB37_11745, partial [Alphaproteobacteria bacterium]|nr:hypothetical protein [Alphaproteobacteria bacterium]
MDLVPLVNGLGGLTSSSETLLTGAGILLIVLFLLFSQFGKRLGVVLNELIFSNWRLALLGLTGLVLSVASGWTTWDGMSNFTNEPILSALVTFGIQGVMLIVAWLIGESFATGMNFRPRGRGLHQPANPALRTLQPFASSVAGILLFSAIGILIYSAFASPSALEVARTDAAPSWTFWWDKLAIAAPVVVLVTLLIVNAGSDVLEDYMQSLRVMIRSAVLWVMFLACMTTSVFFSFDSLFSTIFPANERARAAELRAQNQVAGIVNDIGSLAVTRRLEEQEALFSTEAWQRYEQGLNQLTRVAAEAESELQTYLEEKLRARQADLNRIQESKSSAESQQVSLDQRKAQLNSEIGRLKEQVAGLGPEVARLKGLVFDKDREVIAKTAEAEAEAGGIGVTSIIGRGPKYREIKVQLDRLTEEKRNLELQLREYEKRLDSARERLTRSETQLRQTDGEIAKLKSQSETASRLIAARANRTATIPSFDASNSLQELAKARDAFRRQPTAEGLASIQILCGTIVGAMQSIEPLKGRISSLSCDPGAASEAASRVFALNTGIVALQQTCIGGGKLPASGGPDPLFGFARRCVQESGLPSRDTDALRQQINTIELNRDDKAHRFVVTTNAFQDGNKLAYLALSIAIAIDLLVFMSGLFGANAVRSPLSDVPSHKGRSARQLDDVIENALLPDKFENATHALEAIQPVTGVTPPALGPGWTHEAIVLENEITAKLRLLKVLNAGATIGAVRRDEAYPARYFIRSELLEFLNQIAKSAFEKDKDKVKLAELRKILTVALQPYVSDHADIVLGYMHPISEKSDFTSEIFISEVAAGDKPIVQRSLNAGSTLEYVQRDNRKEERDRFYIHRDFYRVLATISADHSKYGRRGSYGHHQIAGPEGAVDGGRLGSDRGEIGVDPERLRIGSDVATDPTDMDDADEADRPSSSDEELGREYLDKMLIALQIKPERLTNIRDSAVGAARAASKSFTQQCTRFATKLKRHENEARDRIDRIFEDSMSQERDEHRRRLLDDALQEIDQNWSIVVMLPNGPYEKFLEQMISKYEQDAGEGTLSADDGLALRDARSILQVMRPNPRDS